MLLHEVNFGVHFAERHHIFEIAVEAVSFFHKDDATVVFGQFRLLQLLEKSNHRREVGTSNLFCSLYIDVLLKNVKTVCGRIISQKFQLRVD